VIDPKLQQTLLRAAVGVLVVVSLSGLGIAALKNFEDGRDIAFELSAPAWFFLLAIQAVVLVIAAYAWRFSLKAFAQFEMPFDSALAQTGLMQLSKYIPGKVWGILVKGWMSRSQGLPFKDSVRVSLVEQFVTMGLGLVGGLTLLVTAAQPAALLPAVVFVAALASAGAVGFVHIYPFLLKHYHRFRGTANPEEITRIPRLTTVSFLVGQHILIWCLVASVIAVLLAGLGVDLEIESLATVTGATMLSVTIGLIAFFAPGGIGIREGSLILLLSHSLGVENAAMFAICLRLWTTAYDVLASATAGIVLLKGLK
tara:strand:+ start:96847 stop:97785 length:939 start_codon:yes stop_codon:yes gene_type:complete